MKQINLIPLALLSIFACNIYAADIVAETKPAEATRPTPIPAAKGPSLELSIEAARVAIETCSATGGQKIGVSVVDSAGVLKVLLAADGTSPRGVQSSTNKAVTAITFKIATSQLGEQAKADNSLSAKLAANPNFNARPGGILIKVGDEIIGAIGVGGGKTDADCAIAGLQKIQSRL